MTNSKATKKALISSVLALLLCFAMLLGTTFAWFTDEATSSGNIIQSGKLDVNMYWAKGELDPEAADTQWTEAKSGPIFNNDKWEPGYVEAKHIKIANEGTLALKYQMRILANGVVSELANVIDVYCFKDDTGALKSVKLDRGFDKITGAVKLGTLSDILGNDTEGKGQNISQIVKGTLDTEENKEDIITLAFKMQETAGNEYQDLSIGADFSIQVLATQLTSEKDSFGTDYDAGADFAPQTTPAALVKKLSRKELTVGVSGENLNGYTGTLDVGFQFEPTETYEQALTSEYVDWYADYVVSADAATSNLMLAGYYSFYCDNPAWVTPAGSWIGFTSGDQAIPANQKIHLLKDAIGFPNVTYDLICMLGNDGVGFRCGLADLTGENAGTTVTVDLRLYTPEIYENGDLSTAVEGTDYITIGTFSYVIGGEYTTLDDGSEVFMADDGDVVLTDVSNVTATNYFVPDGVTTLGGNVFKQNSNITTVVIPDTVTDFGATDVSETAAYNGAFKESNVETVVIPEGMTEIPAAAFSGAKKLTSVNIPSSVETIGVWAFRETALTELIVPATVKEIKYGAFRTMPNLVKVTVEGSPAIEKYAFRECPALSEVYLLGADVTFPMTGQHFTKDSAGDATGITVYVANAIVAARIYTACADDISNGLTVKVGDENASTEPTFAKDQSTLNSAITSGGTVVLGSGTYKMPSNSNSIDITIAGTKDTVVDVTKGAYLDSSKVSFEGITIKTGTDYVYDENGNKGSDYAALYTPNVTYTNCTFEGPMRVGRDGAKFINCTFNNLGNDYVWTYGNDVIFEGCTFNTEGKAILIYSDGGNEVANVTVKNCTFNATKKAYAGAVDNENWPCAAIEIDNYGNGVNLVTEGNTYDTNFSGEWRIKSYNSAKPDVVINGVKYTKTAVDGKFFTVTVSGAWDVSFDGQAEWDS